MPPALRTPGPPVTNIRNTSSPHWRGWLKPENRCLVPFNSFAEYAPETNPEAKKKDVVWFALNDDAGDPDDRRGARYVDARTLE
jgi:putative SOS response-associated peptidase YedK